MRMSSTSRLNRLLDAATTLTVIATGGALLWTLFVRSPEAQQTQPQVENVRGMRILRPLVTNANGDGVVAIVEFSDFQCPYCAQYARDVMPVIRQTLLDTGQARYVAMHFPIEAIHPFAPEAAEAAECASEEGRFWEMRSRLFDDTKRLGRAELIEHAQSVGVDVGRFRECLETGRTREKVRAHQAVGRRIGVMGTPSFFIGTVSKDGGIDLVKRIRGVVPASILIDEVQGVHESLNGIAQRLRDRFAFGPGRSDGN
jgi:protein-disulfide isomerase